MLVNDTGLVEPVNIALAIGNILIYCPTVRMPNSSTVVPAANVDAG